MAPVRSRGSATRPRTRGTAGQTPDVAVLLALALARCDGPVVLVLDDFHEITDDRVLRDVAQLLRVAPASFRLVIASRVDPELPVPRLRVLGQLAELRGEALSFTVEEAQRLLASHGLPLRTSDVAALVRRTEGWAAALVLSSLSLRDAPDPRQAIVEFAADGRALSEFMETELLDRLPGHLQDLLARTSAVDELCAGLADAILDGRGGAELLAELERRHCFIVSLDERGEWFRYHRLFGELLRGRFARLPRAERDAVHARAARWLADDGRLVDAMRHAIAGGQWDLAAGLAADGWLDAFLAGRSAPLRSVLGDLPAEFAEREPAIAIALAAVNLELGELDRADTFLELARAAIGRRPGDARPVGAARARDAPGALGRAAISRVRWRWPASCWPAARHGAHPPERRALALLLLGSSEIWTGDARAASRHLRASIALARRFDQPYLLLGGVGNLALLQVVEGRLEAGIELAGEALELATEGGWDEVAAERAGAAGAGLGAAAPRRSDGRGDDRPGGGRGPRIG